jgi:mono/diheme cytochrome c family protein
LKSLGLIWILASVSVYKVGRFGHCGTFKHRNTNSQEENTVNITLGKRLAVVVVALAILALPLASFAADTAADVFKSKCAMCHGPDGKGKMAGTKDLGSAEVQKASDADLTATITNGKPPKMPSYKGKLTDDQIKDLVKYVRTFKK